MTTTALLTHAPLSLDKVLPLTPRFMKAGGTYQQVVDTRDGEAIFGVRLSYGGKSVLVANPRLGSSGISLLLANNLDTGFIWEELNVQRDRLDTVLYDWLSIPEGLN